MEIALSGGHMTAGVVRIDDTVRRPLSQNSALVHTLLQHLETYGFKGAPLFSGIDEASREILSYLEGEVPSDLRWHSDIQLQAAAKLIWLYNEATVAMAQAHSAEVICHNDLSPCNFVFMDDLPYAMIDFDAAAPGSRIEDLSYAAWMWLDVGDPEITPVEQVRRLDFFVMPMDCASIQSSHKPCCKDKCGLSRMHRGAQILKCANGRKIVMNGQNDT